MSKKPRIGRIYRRSNTGPWWIAYFHNGREIRESTKSTNYTDAENALKQRHADIIAGRFGGIFIATRITVADLLDDLLHDYEVNQKSIQWARYVDGHLRPFFGQHRANTITTRLIQEYITRRREQGIKNSTINRELSLLRRAYNLAMKTDPPKVTSIPRIPHFAEHNVRKGFFEPAQYEQLLAALPGHLQPIVTFAYHTGCRKGEILNLRWHQVDLATRSVRLEPGETKNDDARIIPLTTTLHDLLSTLKATHDEHWPRSPWVFSRNGEQIKYFNDAWKTACKTAGLTDEYGNVTRVFHDLRRTGVRNLVRAGVPEVVAMKISGHKTRSVFDRYNIVSEADLHHAATQLDNYLKKP